MWRKGSRLAWVLLACLRGAATAMRTSSCTAPILRARPAIPEPSHCTVVCKSEPPRPSTHLAARHPPTDARTHTLAPSEPDMPACLPTHPGNESGDARYAVRECHVCKPAIHLSIHLSSQCHSARACCTLGDNDDSLHSVEAHVAGRAHASTCTAGRLVTASGDSSRSRASPHRRRWTPRCSEPGYGGVGVTVHRACDPSQPSVTQSDALPGQPKIPYRKVVHGICASVSAPLLLLECSHTACGESLCQSEPVSAPHTSRLQRHIY